MLVGTGSSAFADDDSGGGDDTSSLAGRSDTSLVAARIC